MLHLKIFTIPISHLHINFTLCCVLLDFSNNINLGYVEIISLAYYSAFIVIISYANLGFKNTSRTLKSKLFVDVTATKFDYISSVSNALIVTKEEII